MVKWHPNLVSAVEDALRETVERPYPADKVLARLFRDQPRWGARDRAFVAENVYDILRYLRRYADLDDRPLPWSRILGWHFAGQGLVLPDWPVWQDLPPPPHDWTAPDCPLAIRESYSDWMDAVASSAYGNRWPTLAVALNRPAPLVLRVNPLRSSPSRLLHALTEAGLSARQVGDLALELDSRANVFRLQAFHDGWFEVQDLASQQVAPALDLKPGLRVVDGCAGAGGKTLHIATLMENSGQILALEPDQWKLKELRKRATRAGADNILIRPSDQARAVRRLHDQADRVLLDVPCTGSGVLRRNPDAKWRIDQTLLDRCLLLQHEILRQYAPVCRQGGRLVYATCSIFPQENRQQIDLFLDEHPEYHLREDHALLPDNFGYDGFYIAVLDRS